MSFDQEDAAHAALERMVREDPDAAGRLVLVALDDDGSVVSDWVPGERVTQAA